MSTTEARLFLPQDEWDSLSSKLQDPFFVRVADHCRQFVREYPNLVHGSISEVSCWALGGADPGEILHARVLKNILQRSAVVWYLDQDQAAWDLILKAIDCLCDELEWGPTYLKGKGDADLHTGDMLYCAAFALDVLGTHLDDDYRNRLITSLRDQGLMPYLRGLENRNWWRQAEFNWGPAMHGNAGLGALALEPYDPEFAAKALREAKNGIQYAIEYFQPGGGWIEGMMYQSTAMGHLIDFAVPLYRVKGDDLGLLGNRNFHDAFESRTQMVGGDDKPYNFSDCEADTIEWYLPHSYWFAQRLNRPEWAAFEDRFTKTWRDLHGLFHDTETFWYRETNQETGEWQLQQYYRCDGLDWHFWRGEKSWLALRAGVNGGNRGNWDLGSFILGHGNDRFCFDPSHEGRATECHNAITVRGHGQADQAHCPVINARHWEDGCYLCCDMHECFPNSVGHYLRHLLLIGDKHLLVLDDVFGRRGQRNSARWYLTTRLDVETDEGVRICGQGANMQVRFLTPISEFEVKEWEYSKEPIHTLTWTDEYDKVRSIMPVLLSFADEQADWRLEGDCFSITLGGTDWHLDLAAGTLSRNDDLV